MESHGDIARPQQGAQGRIRADHLLQELRELLNSIGGGVNRSMEKWKKEPPLQGSPLPSPSRDTVHTEFPSQTAADEIMLYSIEASPAPSAQLPSPSILSRLPPTRVSTPPLASVTTPMPSITTNASNIESQDALIKSIIKLRGCTKVAVIKSSTKMLCRKEFFLFSYVLYLGVYGASDTQKAGNERSIFNGASIEDVLNFKINIDDYCDEDNYKKGDFTSPKRRISEVKCLDYIWTTRYKQFEFDRSECIKEIVIGGRPAFYGEFPHMGALGWRSTSKENEWEFKCGASLISERFMLTAAHCTYVSTRYGTVANHQPEIVKLGDKFLINVNIFYYLTN
ncbi:unnamed protein product, partial [Brenthis ino]